MKNLEKGFRCCLFVYVILNCISIKAQNTNKIAIDTLFIENKLYALLLDKEISKNKLLMNEPYEVYNDYITQVLDSFSNDYLFFEGTKAFSFNGKGTYQFTVYCVWDIKNKKFIDTIDYVNFNKIVNTNTKNLNCYDKAILYELLTFRQLEGRFKYSINRKKKYERIHKKKFDLNSQIFNLYFLGNAGYLNLSCNKEIYSLINSSTNQILYLPRVTLSDDGRRNVKDFFIQVFYFNEGGELINTVVLKDFIKLQYCE